MGRWDPWEQQEPSAELVLEVIRSFQNDLDWAEKEKSRAYPRIKEEILDKQIADSILVLEYIYGKHYKLLQLLGLEFGMGEISEEEKEALK
tara:strand:+ start:688 stop:960 length:273 start_codon:yes stop_codon:yes gene_type:complete